MGTGTQCIATVPMTTGGSITPTIFYCLQLMCVNYVPPHASFSSFMDLVGRELPKQSLINQS
jgi:hypothetical protein